MMFMLATSLIGTVVMGIGAYVLRSHASVVPVRHPVKQAMNRFRNEKHSQTTPDAPLIINVRWFLTTQPGNKP